MIRQAEQLSCVSHFANASSFLQALPTLKCDIYWLDISLPDGSGIALTKQIKALYPQASCLICSLHDDDENIFHALQAGADGYLLKNAGATKMIEGIYELDMGGSPMSPFLVRKVIKSFQEPEIKKTGTEGLSAAKQKF